MAERKKTAVQETAEQEYVVLNRQAEEGDSQTGQHSLAEYTRHAGYQYFDCKAIRKEMRLTNAVNQKNIGGQDIAAGSPQRVCGG